MLWLTKELRLYLYGMWEELELKWLCRGLAVEVRQFTVLLLPAMPGETTVIEECSVLMAMVGRNGRIPPASLSLLTVSRCFKKIPATGFRNQFKHMPSFPESFGRVLALLGLSVGLVNVRNTLWCLE